MLYRGTTEKGRLGPLGPPSGYAPVRYDKKRQDKIRQGKARQGKTRPDIKRYDKTAVRELAVESDEITSLSVADSAVMSVISFNKPNYGCYFKNLTRLSFLSSFSVSLFLLVPGNLSGNPIIHTLQNTAAALKIANPSHQAPTQRSSPSVKDVTTPMST